MAQLPGIPWYVSSDFGFLHFNHVLGLETRLVIPG